MSDNESETSEFCRASEVGKIVRRTTTHINELRDDVINEKRKNMALEAVTKELSHKYKTENNRVKMLEQELEYYKTKSTKKVNTSLSEKSLEKLFQKKDAYIAEKSNEGVEDMIEQLRKQYL